MECEILMADCQFCGCLRLNGMPIEKGEEGDWQRNTGPLNPVREDLKFACRDCATERLTT